MKTAILAMVVLAIVQASAPVPRKAADQPARTSNSVKQDSSNKHNPPDARMRFPRTAESNQTEGQEERSRDTQETIIIREPAAVPRKDMWDEISAICAMLLVLVGGLGICAALGTLRAIKRQADLMEGGIHVEGVRVIEFEGGKNPIFFVKIMNSGMIPKPVSVSMKVELGDLYTEYVHDQAMTIPATGGWRECFIRFANILGEADRLELERGNMILRISGRIAGLDKKPIEYCYKYNAWPFDKRPPDLPLFVACEFDTRIAANAVAKVKAMPPLTVSIGQVTARGESSDTKASNEPPEPSC